MLVLLGASGTGKSSIQKKLIGNYGYKPIVTWTTRDKRPNEVGGIDYNFCTEEEFRKLNEIGFFAETTSYVMAGGNKVYYGTAIEDLKDDRVIVLNPEGYKKLKKLNSINIKSFLIFTPKPVLQMRLQTRGDIPEEINRRLEADEKDFNGMGNEVDYIIENLPGYSLDYLAELIRMLDTEEVAVIE